MRRPSIVASSSGFQSSMSKLWETTRVPGFKSLEQLRTQPHIDVRQQVQRHYRGGLDVCFKEIVSSNLTRSSTPAFLALVRASCTRSGLMSTPTPLGAIILGGADDDTAIAAAEIVNDIGFGHFGQFKHSVHNRVGAGNEEERPDAAHWAAAGRQQEYAGKR